MDASRDATLFKQHVWGEIIRWLGKKNSRREVETGLPAIYPRLWRFCYALSGSRDRADDLAQTTAARALEQHTKFQPGSHLDRWLFVMARRIWLNDMRAEAVRKGGGLVPTDDLVDEKNDVLTNILAGEVLSRVRTLPEAQRVTVMLVYVEGYSYAESAEILDIPIGTVMSRLAAARKTLTVALGDAKKAAE